MQPGSFARRARAARVESGTAAAAIASPDIKSPTACERLPPCIEEVEAAIAPATRRAAAEPPVPGATGASPAPNPVAKSIAIGDSRNARRRSSVDTRSPRRDDRVVLIASSGDTSEDYNRPHRAEVCTGESSGKKGRDMSSVKSSEKWRAVETALTQIERQFGKGSIMRLGDQPEVPIAVIPTGSLAVDAALGVGGIPRGRVVEIFGPESSGKTTLSLQIIAQAQRSGGLAAFIDAEHALDAEYAKKLGVETENLLVSQPDNGEQALEIAEMLIRSGAIDVIVIDSVAALVPKAEIEGEVGEAQMGLQAGPMAGASRRLTAMVAKSRTSLIFINQIREKIGVLFGNPETTTGGRALKFYASIRIDIRRIASLKDGETVVGSRTKVKVVKNKVASPFRQAEFDINYGEGISREGELIDMGLEAKLVEKSGAWLSYGDLRIGQGRENSKQFLKDNPELAAEIERKLRQNMGLAPIEPAPAATAPAAVAEAVREKEKARR